MPSISNKDSLKKTYKTIFKRLKTITKCPEDFLSIQQLKSEEVRTLLKDIYDFTILKDTKNKNNVEVLQELVVEFLDEEQIWQLLELRNNIVWPQVLESTSKLLSLQETKFKVNFANEENEEKGNGENHSEDESDSKQDFSEDGDEDEEIDYSQEVNKSKKLPKSKGKSSIVDDQFFKLSEMEAFLVAEDEKEFNKQKGNKVVDDFSINYFDDNLDEEEDEYVEYKDFFDDDVEGEPRTLKENNKNVETSNNNSDEDDGEADDNSDEEEYANESLGDERHIDSMNPAAEESFKDSEEEVEKPKSSFEERQERLNQRIRDYEQDILGEKPWQLKGEIQATNRPQNSLLEEILEFEATTRPAPIITEETTLRLEDIIRQRIKDQAWDDVELKVKPLSTPQEYRKQLVLDQEKSKESLAQIYEKQYQKEIEKLDPNSADAKEEEPQSHKEIKEMMRSLFVKLDALSNFHFTPKPIAPEPKIITNTPAVNMEEVAPVAVSSAKLLAPEEIRKRAKGDILGSNERNKTDKNRDRRHKKQKQRAVNKALEERDIQKQKLGIKLSKKEEQAKTTKSLLRSRNVEKVSVSNDAGSMKSSKTFFSKLQETVSIQNKNTKKHKKADANTLSAKKLKL